MGHPTCRGPRYISRLALTQGPEFPCIVRRAQTCVQAISGFGFAIIGEGKGSEVHGDRGLRVQNAVGFDGFLRRHVHWSHEPLRLESTDREQGESERVELRVDGGEVIAETCIAGKVNRPIGSIRLPIRTKACGSCRRAFETKNAVPAHSGGVSLSTHAVATSRARRLP